MRLVVDLPDVRQVRVADLLRGDLREVESLAVFELGVVEAVLRRRAEVVADAHQRLRYFASVANVHRRPTCRRHPLARGFSAAIRAATGS